MKTARPSTESFFARLAARHPDPRAVQRLLRTLPYNRERDGETQRSAIVAWRHRRAHCLEAAFLAAAILEHRGFPPLVLSLESQDQLDHVVYVFQNERGNWGAIARSRDEGLHGRAPRFRSPRELARSYQVPYVDLHARITGYAVAHLDDTDADWRASPRGVWKTVRHLIRLKHTPLRMPDSEYRRALASYERVGAPTKGPSWW